MFEFVKQCTAYSTRVLLSDPSQPLGAFFEPEAIFWQLVFVLKGPTSHVYRISNRKIKRFTLGLRQRC